MSLGYYRTLFSVSGASTSSEIPEEEQKTMGLSPGLIRFSIGLDHDIERTFQDGAVHERRLVSCKTDWNRYEVSMRLVSFTLMGLIACSGELEPPSATSETNMIRQAALDALVQKWKRSQNQFTLEMKTLSDMERLYVVRQILSNPKAEHSPRTCVKH